MTGGDFAASIWRLLETCRSVDSDVFDATLYSWMDYHKAALPSYPLIVESVRDDARLWASGAGAPELESYVIAALSELDDATWAEKQTKRIAAMAWRRMSASSKAAFKEWINKDE